jgi:hypothetical protein
MGKDPATAGAELLRDVHQARCEAYTAGWNACREIVEELTDNPVIIAAMRRDTPDKEG